MVILKHIQFTILALIIVTFSFPAKAQDVHFSHYQALPLLQNPAFSGSYEGDFELGMIHRNQWNVLGKPFVTTAATFDHKLFLLPLDWGVGMTVLDDQSGELGLRQTRILLSSGVHLQIGRDKLGFGFQGGMNWKSYGLDGITYPGQYSRDLGQFDPDLPSGEANVSDQLNFFDLNAGLLYQVVRSWGNWKSGIAIHHINGPRESFLDRSERLEARYVLESRAEIKVGNQYFLLPSIYVQEHNGAHEILPGFGAGIYVKENSIKLEKVYLNTAFRSGINRNGDALIASGVMEFNQLKVFLTYDYNYSDFSDVTRGNGGLEFAFIFTGLSSEIKEVVLPCDRY